MKRRPLQAIAGKQHGGAEIFFVRLAMALARAGENQSLVIRRDADRSRHLRDAGIAVTELGFRHRLDVATRFAFRREIARSRPQIVMTWMSRATQLCPPGDFVHIGRLGGYYDLKYYRHCNHLIGNTRGIVAYMIESGWPAKQAHYLPNFVPDLAGVVPVDRAAFETPVAVPLALALGRLHPNKGFDLLLDALALTPELHLWIVGEGPLRGALKQQAASLGIVDRVRFLNWREDVSALLATADFLVSSSRHEPLGNVVIEAWSARRAVVATATVGPSELIEPGVTGLLTPIAPAALAGAMTTLSRDASLRDRLALGGRRAYEAEFTEDLVVARYRRLFDELAV